MTDQKEVKYRKLPGSGLYTTTPQWVVTLLFFIIGIFVLTLYRRRFAYLGPDHLLVLDNEGYHETYRFFNFRDIQALRMVKTINFRQWAWVFAISCGLTLWAATAFDEPVVAGFFYTTAGCSLTALIIHLLKGPTVAFRLETAVSTIELPSLNRLRRAERVVSELRPLIEAAQGRLHPDELAGHLATVQENGGQNPPVPPARGTGERRSEPVSDYGGRWHRLAYGTLFIEGLMTLLTIFHNSMPMVLGGMLMFLAAGAFAITAWSSQRDSRIPKKLQTLTKAVVIYLGIAVFVAWIETIVVGVANPGIAAHQDLMLQHWASLNPPDHPWLLLHCLVFGFLSVLLGSFGMLWSARAGQSPERMPAVSPPQLPSLPKPPPISPAEMDATTPDSPTEAQFSDEPDQESPHG